MVISRLHRGQKRLVFVDSRARAEELGAALRQLGITAFVTHSSLSQEQRREAEDAFANRDDCVIVATSVLELGVNVGNLDRVIQIDSPTTVSSFLQRMGRTGRRQGSVRNCLFLACRDETLVQAAGLIDLWHKGYVEPIQPPPEPIHVLAQQLMALILQEQGIGRYTWLEWVAGVPAFADMPPEHIQEVVAWMLAKGMLWEEQGILGIGQKGEETYGRRHFLELLSVFLSPPLFTVLHGRQALGFVNELTFLGKQDGSRVLLLGGRAWRVTHIDWQRKVAHVEVSQDQGRTRWKGQGQGLSFRLSQAIKAVLDRKLGLGGRNGQDTDRRGARQVPLGDAEGTVVVGKETAWHGGPLPASKRTPAWPRRWRRDPGQATNDSLAIEFERALSLDSVQRAIEELRLATLDAATGGGRRGPGGHEVL